MDFTQQKLTKSEWDFLEVPVTKDEKTILQLIYNGYDNVNHTYNTSKSLLGYMKIGTDDIEFHLYLYESYFKKMISKIIKKNTLQCDMKKLSKNIKSRKKLKQKDLIRIRNSSKKMDGLKDTIYEFVILKNISKFFYKKLCPMRYYTLTQLMKNNVTYVNKFVLKFVNFILNDYKCKIDKVNLVKNAYIYIEKNTDVFRFNDMKLYSHQGKLFSSIKREGAKLILYQAPTGTGKTLSPVGIAKGKKVVFTCAAKHIGLQLAKACISMEIPSSCSFWM